MLVVYVHLWAVDRFLFWSYKFSQLLAKFQLCRVPFSQFLMCWGRERKSKKVASLSLLWVGRILTPWILTVLVQLQPITCLLTLVPSPNRGRTYTWKQVKSKLKTTHRWKFKLKKHDTLPTLCVSEIIFSIRLEFRLACEKRQTWWILWANQLHKA